jgi:hypothetical protein
MMGFHFDALAGLGLSLGWQGGLAGGTGAAALPALALQQLWLPLGWGLVLAALVRWFVERILVRSRSLDAPDNAAGRFRSAVSWGAAAAVLLWSCWPGPLSVSYSLGLAFQAPSGLAVVLTCGALWRAWYWPSASAAQDRLGRTSGMVEALGWWALALLGWVLLLDTFAWWPMSLYAWGFGPQALGWVALAALLPIVVCGWRLPPAAYALPLVLLWFVALRLPTGNVWDAVLDPWLWVWAQCVALRQLWFYLKMLRKQ